MQGDRPPTPALTFSADAQVLIELPGDYLVGALDGVWAAVLGAHVLPSHHRGCTFRQLPLARSFSTAAGIQHVPSHRSLSLLGRKHTIGHGRGRSLSGIVCYRLIGRLNVVARRILTVLALEVHANNVDVPDLAVGLAVQSFGS